jgi:hypothetical protein
VQTVPPVARTSGDGKIGRLSTSEARFLTSTTGLIGFDVETAWRFVRPELLRLLKRGTHTTANEQYALAA